MRSIGLAQRALDKMITRATDPRKKTFGKQLYQHGPSSRYAITLTRAGGVVAEIAKSRMELDQARLLVITAANQVRRVLPEHL